MLCVRSGKAKSDIWSQYQEWVMSMALNVRNRIPAVDVLQIDYEYCTISYYVEGARNALGEPSRTLTERATDVRCSIDPLNQTPSYIRQSGLRDILRQGVIERAV